MRHRSSVAVVESDRGELHLVLSPARSMDTHVVRVCSTTGVLEHGTVPGVDLFQNEQSAVGSLRNRGLAKRVTRGCALLGYVNFGECARVLVALKVKTAVVLPNGHEVLTVTESTWFNAGLRDPTKNLTRDERAKIASLAETNLDGLYFYCETFDVTAPFALSAGFGKPKHVDEVNNDRHSEQGFLNEQGSPHVRRNENQSQTQDSAPGSKQLDQQWVWNKFLSREIRALGIENAVPDLLQGLAESRRLRDLRGVEYRVAVFGRRSSAHPGTRYLARGLNEFAAPGNEVEMEQLVWRRDSARSAETCDTCEGDEHSSSTPDTMTPSTSGTSASDVTSGAKKTTVPQKKPLTPSTDTVRWSSYVWRRGSVPIRWRQEIKQSIGDAEIFVASDAPYAGTGSYFSRLAFDYRPLDATPNDGFPVTCVNLLRCAPGKPEVLLSEHFHEAVRGVRRRAGLSGVTVLNFDWHGNIKQLGESKTVEGLWKVLRGSLVDAGVAVGVCGAVAEHGAGNPVGGSNGSKGGAHSRRPIDSDTSKNTDDASADEKTKEKEKPFRENAKQTHAYQRGLLRYNCADSLDRTNLASYFAAVQVLAEQCRVLDLEISTDAPTSSGSSSSVSQKTAESVQDHNDGADFGRAVTYGRRDGVSVSHPPPPSESLPTGWESRYDTVTGRTFYIDHNTRTTQWSLPAEHVLSKTAPGRTPPVANGPHSVDTSKEPGSPGTKVPSESDLVDVSSKDSPHDSVAKDSGKAPWRLLNSTVDDVRQSLAPDALVAMCEIFLANGDLHSAVYTASRAIHTSIFHLLDGSSSSVRSTRGSTSASAYAAASSLSNLSISAQRRFLNLTQDATRQAQFEMFLGAKRWVHFPSLVSAENDASASLERGDNSDDADDITDRVSTVSTGNGADGTRPSPQTQTQRPGLSSATSSQRKQICKVLSRPPNAAVLAAPKAMGDPLCPPSALLGAATANCATPLWVCGGVDGFVGGKQSQMGDGGGRDDTVSDTQSQIVDAGEVAVSLAGNHAVSDTQSQMPGRCVTIWLGQPGFVSRVLLTSPRGAPESVVPFSVEVACAWNLDDLGSQPAMTLAIPKTAPGTCMSFSVGKGALVKSDVAAHWRFHGEARVYTDASDDETERSSDSVGSHDCNETETASGVVRLTFRGAPGGAQGKYPYETGNEVLVLPHVEVLGVPLRDEQWGSRWGAMGVESATVAASRDEKTGTEKTPNEKKNARLYRLAARAAFSLNPVENESTLGFETESTLGFETESPLGFETESTNGTTTVSLETKLRLELRRVELGVDTETRDLTLSDMGVEFANADPTTEIVARRVRNLARLLTRERNCASAAALAASPAPRALSAIVGATLSPWEQLMGQGVNVARAVGGSFVASTGGNSSGSLVSLADSRVAGVSGVAAGVAGVVVASDTTPETCASPGLSLQVNSHAASSPDPERGSARVDEYIPDPKEVERETLEARCDALLLALDCAARDSLSLRKKKTKTKRTGSRHETHETRDSRDSHECATECATELRVPNPLPTPRAAGGFVSEPISVFPAHHRDSSSGFSTPRAEWFRSSKNQKCVLFNFSEPEKTRRWGGGLVSSSNGHEAGKTQHCVFVFPTLAQTVCVGLCAGKLGVPAGTRFRLTSGDDLKSLEGGAGSKKSPKAGDENSATENSSANEKETNESASSTNINTWTWTLGTAVPGNSPFALEVGFTGGDEVNATGHGVRLAVPAFGARLAKLQVFVEHGSDESRSFASTTPTTPTTRVDVPLPCARFLVTPSFPATENHTTPRADPDARDTDGKPGNGGSSKNTWLAHFDPTSLAVVDPGRARPDVAAALDSAQLGTPPITRTRHSFELAHFSGSVLHVGPVVEIGGTHSVTQGSGNHHHRGRNQGGRSSANPRGDSTPNAFAFEANAFAFEKNPQTPRAKQSYVSGFKITPPDPSPNARCFAVRVTALYLDEDEGEHGGGVDSPKTPKGATRVFDGGFLSGFRVGNHQVSTGAGRSLGNASSSGTTERGEKSTQDDGPPATEASLEFDGVRASVGHGDVTDANATAAVKSEVIPSDEHPFEKKQPPATRIGDFLIPVVRGGASLRFEFLEPVFGFKRLVFESLVLGGNGTFPRDAKQKGVPQETPPSLVGRIQCFRLG